MSLQQLSLYGYLQTLEMIKKLKTEKVFEVETSEVVDKESESGSNPDIEELERGIGVVTSSTLTLTLEQARNKVLEKIEANCK